jgi:hypothetical protein
VVVDWSAATATDAEPRTRGHVELMARLDAGPHGIWSCLTPEPAGWEQALSASGCSEVVLTTWLGNDPLAKDLVLDLAEHLTQRLKQSKPLIRVRFLQREKSRAA